MDVIVLRVSERQTFEAENRHQARKVGKREAGDHGRSRPIGLTRSTRVGHELKNFPDEFSLGGGLLALFPDAGLLVNATVETSTLTVWYPSANVGHASISRSARLAA